MTLTAAMSIYLYSRARCLAKLSQSTLGISRATCLAARSAAFPAPCRGGRPPRSCSDDSNRNAKAADNEDSHLTEARPQGATVSVNVTATHSYNGAEQQ